MPGKGGFTMEIQEVEIVIEPDGRVRVDVRGVKGPACLAITGPLEQALGGAVERSLKPEHDEVVLEQDDPLRVRGR